MNEQELEQMRQMTVGEVLDLLEDFDPDDLSKVNALLKMILIHAAGFYDDGCECDLRCSAVYLAYIALQDDRIGEETADALAHEMAALARHMLQHDGSETWNAKLRSRFQTINDTHPGLDIND
jgi:hypothetical protein